MKRSEEYLFHKYHQCYQNEFISKQINLINKKTKEHEYNLRNTDKGNGNNWNLF